MREASRHILERVFKTHKATAILKNPSLKEINDITDGGKHSIRFIAQNLGKTVYVWSANEKTHEEVKGLTNTKWPDPDTFYGEAVLKGTKWVCKGLKRFFLPEKVRSQLVLKDWSWLNKYSIDISGALKILGK